LFSLFLFLSFFCYCFFGNASVAIKVTAQRQTWDDNLQLSKCRCNDGSGKNCQRSVLRDRQRDKCDAI